MPPVLWPSRMVRRHPAAERQGDGPVIKRSLIVLAAWAALVGLAWWQAYHRDLARCRGNLGWLYWNCVDAHSLIRDNIVLAGVALPSFIIVAIIVIQWRPRDTREPAPSATGTALLTMPKDLHDVFYGRSNDAP